MSVGFLNLLGIRIALMKEVGLNSMIVFVSWPQYLLQKHPYRKFIYENLNLLNNLFELQVLYLVICSRIGIFDIIVNGSKRNMRHNVDQLQMMTSLNFELNRFIIWVLLELSEKILILILWRKTQFPSGTNSARNFFQLGYKNISW